MSTDNQTRMRESQTLRETKVAAADAQATADAAQSAANSALTSADGKNTVSHIVAGDPRPVGNAVGDLLFEHDTTISGPVTFMGRWDGSDWESVELNTEVIAALDAGKITTGTLNAGLVTVESTISGGSRVVLDNTGLKGYNAANELKTSIGADGTIKAVDGEFVGTFRNAPVGQLRIEIEPTSPMYGGAFALGLKDASGAAKGGIGFAYTEAGVLSGRVDITGSQETASPYSSGIVRIAGTSNPLFPSTSSGSVELVGNMYSSGQGTVSIRGTLSGQSGTVNIVASTVNLTGTVNFTDIATKQSARNSLGLGNTTGPVPVANGGTGVTTAAAERNRLGLGNTTGAVPIANGGTGATTVAAARTALGVRAASDEAYFTSNVTVSSAAGGLSPAISLPSGFTQSNCLIGLTKQSGGLAKYVPYVNWVTSTSFQMGIYSGDGSATSGTVLVFAHVIKIS